jgi:hypothetical protein
MSLFKHQPHPHTPRNINLIHEAEQASAGFNQKIAIALTRGVGTMACAYCFTLLAIAGFPNLLGPSVSQYVQWISQTFIQLTMLSVIMVGQSILGRKAELQAEEAFNTTQKSYHDIEQIALHLQAQDEELLRQDEVLQRQNEELLKQTKMISAILQKIADKQ